MRAVLLLVLSACVVCPTYDTYTNSVMLGNQVKLSYKLLESNTKVKFLLEKSAAGHVVFGIGEKMADADVVTITKSGTTISLNDCKLAGYQAPVCGETAQNWMFATSAADSSEATATSMKVEFMRPLAASGVDSDKALVAGQNWFIYSYTTSDMVAKHDQTGGKGALQIDLTKAPQQSWSMTISVAWIISALIASFYL